MKRLLPLLLLALPAAAAAAPPLEPIPSTTSADRRFVATGPDAEDNLRMVHWAARNARALEDFLGLTFTLPTHSPLVLHLHPLSTNAAANVTIAQRLEGARLLQELQVSGARVIDAEDLLEAFSLLMIHRAVHDVRGTLPPGALRGAASVPSWFSTGCAQNLHRTLRARNRAAVLRTFAAGGGMTAADLLRLQSLPRGRWASKAECGMFLAWLASRDDFPALRNALLRQFAAGAPVDAPWLCEHLPDARRLDDLEKHWDLWRLHSTQVRSEETGIYDDAPERLAGLFPVTPDRLAALGDRAPARELEAADLAALRAEPWFPALIGALRAETLTLAAGQPSEFKAILAKWGAWYQALLDLPVTARATASGRVEFPAERRKRAAALLQDAQASLYDYRQRLHSLARYTDGYEEHNSVRGVPQAAPPAGPRTEQQQYVDAFDAAREKPAP